jgi:hypothetical protein
MKYRERAKVKINVKMSDKIGTKTPHQCHSRHQKMLRKYGGIENLINFIEDRRDKKKKDQKARERPTTGS